MGVRTATHRVEASWSMVRLRRCAGGVGDSIEKPDQNKRLGLESRRTEIRISKGEIHQRNQYKPSSIMVTSGR